MDINRLADLSIAQLRTFRLVMQEGGYAAAAKKSKLSVPSMWQHIRSLEKVCDTQLFERSGRHVAPTDVAKRLYEQVERIFVQLESSFDVVCNSSLDQPLRLMTGVRMLLEDLAAPLASFQKQYPNKLVIRQGNDRRAQELLLSDEVDIALALEPGLNQSSHLIHYEPAYAIEFLAIANKNHPFMASKTKSLAELAKHDLIVTAAGSHGRDALEQAFHRENLKASILIETDNSAFTITCVSAGMGIGIVAGNSAGNLCSELATHSLSDQLGTPRIVLMWRKGRLLSEPMQAFIDRVTSLGAA